MARTVSPIPTRDELLALAQAALANAVDLLADARLLAQSGSFPRAHALAILACEELGKEQDCVQAIWKPVIRPEVFWDRFASHTQKLHHVQVLLMLESGEPVGPADAFNARICYGSRSAHTRKLRGLYVDYAGGVIKVPGEITEHETERVISQAQAAVDRSQASWDRRVEQATWFAEQSLTFRIIWQLFIAWVAYSDRDTVDIVLRDGWSPVLLDRLRTFSEQVQAAGGWAGFFDSGDWPF